MSFIMLISQPRQYRFYISTRIIIYLKTYPGQQIKVGQSMKKQFKKSSDFSQTNENKILKQRDDLSFQYTKTFIEEGRIFELNLKVVRKKLDQKINMNGKQHNLLSQYFKLVFTHFKKHNPVLERLRYFVKVVKRMGLAEYLPEDSSDGPAMGYSPELKYIDGCKLSSLDPHVIENLPNSKCLACTDHLVRNYPIEGRREEYQQPAIIMNESNFFEEEIKSAICGLCNVGGGYIFYAKKSITNIIKQGFTPMSRDQLDKVKAKVRSAFECIRRKENAEVVVQAVQLDENIFVGGGQKMQVKAIENSEQEETVRFVFRIRVSIRYEKQYMGNHVNRSVKYQKQLYYTQHQFQNFKPTYNMLFVYPKPGQLLETVRWFVKQFHHQYQNIGNYLSSFVKYGDSIDHASIHHRKQCFYPIQQKQYYVNSFNEVIFNVDSKKYIKQTKETKGLPVIYSFNKSPDKLFMSILQQSFNKEIRYESDFPSISSDQTIVLFKFRQQKQEFITVIKQVFKELKTQYKQIKPLIALQTYLSNENKLKINLIDLYELQYFIFKVPFAQFRQQFDNKLNKYKIKIPILYQQLTNKIHSGMTTTQQQIQIFNKFMFDKFTSIPELTKSLIYTDQNGMKIYKNLNLSFSNQNQRNAAVCAFIMLYFGKKRPKCT